MNFLDVAAPEPTNSFEQTFGISPIWAGIVLAVIVIAFIAMFVIGKKNR